MKTFDHLEIPAFLRRDPAKEKPVDFRGLLTNRELVAREEGRRSAVDPVVAEFREQKRQKSNNRIASLHAKQASEEYRRAGFVWSTALGKWIDPNAKAKKMTKTFEEMIGPELVAAYNDMANQLGEKPVTKFATLQKGVDRCRKLAERLAAPATPTEATVTTEVLPPAAADATQESAMPTKAKTKRAPAKAGTRQAEGVLGTRPGTNLNKLVEFLVNDRKGKPTPVGEIVKVLYGAKAKYEENVGKLAGSLKGAERQAKKLLGAKAWHQDGRGSEATYGIKG